jgi:IS605 OrfB family transposase
MQTTLTATLIKNQSSIEKIKTQLDSVVVLHNIIKRKLYKDIVAYYIKNKVNVLPKTVVNQFKQDYQLKYNINARQYNAIYAELNGQIASVLELNKSYLEDIKDKIEYLHKAIKSKQKTLANLVKKINAKNYQPNPLDQVNLSKLKDKLYHLNQKLNKSQQKLVELNDIEKTGNPHLCFGSNKLFRQQFLIGTSNNLTEFKTHEDWLKSWVESRNKSFFLLGSSDETLGNQNCQIKHIGNDKNNNIYELKVNVNPKEPKLKDRTISFQIEVHNDKNNLIQQAILNNLGKDNSKHQALSYRFYKSNGSYKVFISLDKSKQQPKIKSIKQLGTIGIDINADHLSITEVDRFGNLIKSFDLILNLKDKSSDQALDNIACAVKKITDYANAKNKSIVIEKLNFSQKKKELKSSFNKKYNVMLSSFAYNKIIQLIKSRSFDKGIEVIEVNPAYTSKIGKFKYQNKYKLTTHQAAAFVIARRGLLSYSKVVEVKDKNGDIKNKTIIIVNKEKTISNRCSKYYSFELPARTIQRKENIYWKEVELNYLKAKKHRLSLKKKKRNLILDKQKLSYNLSSELSREITQVADNLEANRGLNPNSIPF